MIGTLREEARAVAAGIDRLLTWLEFRSNHATFERWFAPGYWGATSLLEKALHSWEWWALNCFVTMFVVPALIVKLVFKERLSDYGITSFKPRVQIPLALGMYLIVLPAIIGASRSDAFVRTYPLFWDAGSSGSLLLAWELMYLSQFFALEFFFRGYLIFGLEKRIGPVAILVSTVPYCMVHYHKPMLEAYAAIIAGVILGAVAMRTRSLWSGFMTHALVALTMDFLALHARGIL